MDARLLMKEKLWNTAMFCFAARSHPNQLSNLTTADNNTLLKDALNTWSSDTKGFAQRVLAIITNDYIPTFNKQVHLPVIKQTQDVLAGASPYPTHLFPHLFLELITYFGQYFALKSKLGCANLTEVQSKLVGVAGMSLAGIMAAYSFAASDSPELLETNAVLSTLTLLEIGCFAEEIKLWPAGLDIFLLEGLTRAQATTAIRTSATKFITVADLGDNKIIIRGLKSDLDSARHEFSTYKRDFSLKEIPSSLFVWSTVDLHYTSPTFKSIINEALPKIMESITGFSGSKYGIQFPFMKTELKVPYVSCFDGAFEDKALLSNDWGLLPNMGENLITHILEFMMGFVVDMSYVDVSRKYLLRRRSPQAAKAPLATLCCNPSRGQGALVIEDIDCTPLKVILKKEQIPISVNQKMIVLHQYRNPQSYVYNLTDILKLRGTFDRPRLLKAAEITLWTHPSIGTKFAIDADSVTATTLDNEELPRVAENMIHMHEPVAEADLQRVLTQNTKTPMDVFNGQLARVHFVPIANTPFTIVQGIIHHLAGDGYGGFTLPLRFLQIYDTAEQEYFVQRGLRARDVDKHIIAHFNQRQTQLSRTDNELKEHWNELIRSDEFSYGVDMLKSFPSPSQLTYQGKERIRVIESSLWTKLGEVSRKLESTRFHLLTAAWATVVSRYSHQKLINIGTAFHCRKEEWAENVFFASNALPVPVNVDKSQSILELVQDIKRRVEAAKKHEEYPASALVHDIANDPALAAARNNQASNPLFQVEINYYHVPKLPKFRGKLIQIAERLYPEYMQAGLAEISAWFVDMNGKIFCNLKYSTDLYDEATAKQIEDDIFCCLESLTTADTARPVTELKLSSSKAFDTLTRGPLTPLEFTAPVHTILNQVKARAKETAIICEGDAMTYQQLAVVIGNIAERLRDQPRGAVIGVFVERSVDFVAAMLGIMAAGCVYLPLNLSNPAERIQTIITDAAARAILIHAKTVSMSAQFGSTAVIQLDMKALASSPSSYTLPALSPEDPAYTIFTSGSTGKPKGVLVPHRALANFVDWELSAFKYPHGMTFMQMFEFSFDASLQDVFACLCSGNRLLLAKEKGNKDPEYLVDQFAKYNVSRTNMVPSQLSLVLEYLTQDPKAVSKCHSLRTVGQGGEALHLSSVERVHKILPHVQIVNFYGPTEACILCSYFDCGSGKDSTITELKGWAKGVASSASEIIPIGRPINNASMLILDEDLNLTPVGVSGEVFIGGQCLALGYLNNPDQTKAKFIVNPFNGKEMLYASGDLAKYLPNGLIQYLGRKDKQIKLRGYRIECAEIESVILFNRQVIKAFVTVKKNPSEYLAAYLTTDAAVKDRKQLLEQVLQDLKAKLPTYMVPSRLFWMNTFPLTINGKVDESHLPSDLETSATVFGISASTSTAALVAPKDEIEKSLCTYFASLLHMPETQVGTNSNFFEIGGTSIHAFNIVSTVKQNFGYKLDLQLFFKDPTVAALAALIRQSETSEAALSELKKFSITPLDNYEIVKLKEASESPSLNLFLVHGAFRNTSVFNSLAQHFPPNFNVYAFQDTNPLEVEELDWDDPHEMEQMAARYVEKILAVQPIGSYHICGYCFGGVLALEMVVQLLEKKKNVCTLALLDSTAPTATNAKGFGTLDSAAIYALLATEVLSSFNVKKELNATDFRSVAAQKQLDLMLATLEQSNVDSKAALPFIKRAFQHYTSSSTLLVNYAHREFDGDLYVFSATEEWAFIDNYNPMRLDDLGWCELHDQTVVIPTPGNHLSIIKREDSCQFIAQKLSQLIEDREGTTSLRLQSGRETIMLSSDKLARSLGPQEKVPNDINLDIASESIQSKIKRAVFYSLHAPSSSNNQPWHFIVDEQALRVLICHDRSRITNAISSQMITIDVGCSLYILQSLLEVYGLNVELTHVRGNPALLAQASKDIQRVANKSRALEPLVYLEIRTQASERRARASTILVGPDNRPAVPTATQPVPNRRSPPPPAPSPKQVPDAMPKPLPKAPVKRDGAQVAVAKIAFNNNGPKQPLANAPKVPSLPLSNQASQPTAGTGAKSPPPVPARMNRTTSTGNVKTHVLSRSSNSIFASRINVAPSSQSASNSPPTSHAASNAPPSQPQAKSPQLARAPPKLPARKSVSHFPKQIQSTPRPKSPSPPQSNTPQDSPRELHVAQPPTPTTRPQAQAARELPQLRPSVSSEVVAQVEQVVLNRCSNRHDYSTRKPIPFKILKELSNDQFVNQQHNVKTLWINDRAKIQRIAKWAELVDQAIYASKRLSTILMSAIAQKENDVNRAIPLWSLELSLMQMTNFMAFAQAGPSEETIKLMKTNVTIARGTSRKMLNSAGLAVVCYQGGAPSWQTLMRVGQTIAAILLKLSQHDIATSVWGNSGAMDLLHTRLTQAVSDPHLLALRDQVADTLHAVQELLSKARLVMPELSENEGVVSIIRFGYALQEPSQKAERLPVSKSVTVL